MSDVAAFLLLIGIIVGCVYLKALLTRDQVPRYNGVQIKCPRCNSTNYQVYVENQVIIPEKTKRSTSVNINPLKPFTILNHNEKVVHGAVNRKVSSFICNNCGNMFR